MFNNHCRSEISSVSCAVCASTTNRRSQGACHFRLHAHASNFDGLATINLSTFSSLHFAHIRPVFNEMARVAYRLGATYFYRTNDDTELTSPWVSPFVKALKVRVPARRYTCLPTSTYALLCAVYGYTLRRGGT